MSNAMYILKYVDYDEHVYQRNKKHALGKERR